MHAIARLERECADAWPALVDEPLGEWRLRAAGGFTGRVNSTLTIGDPGVDIANALVRTVEFAARHGTGPCAHVVNDSPAEAEIARLGWTVNLNHPGGAESLVMTGPLTAGSFEDAQIHETPPPTWWELVLSSSSGVGYGVLAPVVLSITAIATGFLAERAIWCLAWPRA